jgi:hypothetical protein
MKQTAVEWLVEHLTEYGFDLSHHEREIQQAKEMEKEQRMEAMDWIMNKYFEFHEQPTTSAREQYYNETFKSE